MQHSQTDISGQGSGKKPFAHMLEAFSYSKKALALVWETSPLLSMLLGIATVLTGTLPAAAALVGQKIVDAVVQSQNQQLSFQQGWDSVFNWVILEAVIMILIAASTAGITACQALIRGLLAEKVNVMILEKALTLRLQDFENADFYDRLTRARREASTRPLSLVNRTFSLIQNTIAMASFGFLLWQFSPWAVLIVVIGGLPSFFSETRFSMNIYRMMRWRSPDARKRMYIETVLSREDYAKEVKLFSLGRRLLDRYKKIYRKLYKEERRLTLQRGSWGLVFTIFGTALFYIAYAWIVMETIRSHITLGEMTMYLLVFKQGQSAVSSALAAMSGMYEDNLYLSNLYEYLEADVPEPEGWREQGESPGAGLLFEKVGFSYPGSDGAVLSNINLKLEPGESLALVGENGSGKTTLIKLLVRLYEPTEGTIYLDGSPLGEWKLEALRVRVGVIFQDFIRYQFPVGENIGTGDERYFEDEASWKKAAKLSQADEFIQRFEAGYHTQLGRWFAKGRELSGGQWQKVALARAFMREDAQLLVLDEPTAAMDAEAEAKIFEHFRKLMKERMSILISHRFSTVRHASQIIVLDQGQIIERGDHNSLMSAKGHYQRLFDLQAAGYRD
ncbi:MAG: ABC transporter ATP-binding protein [bacterium]